MRNTILIVAGILLIAVGVTWGLQGFGYIGGSFMSGTTLWSVIGPLVAVAGVVLFVLGLRASRASR